MLTKLPDCRKMRFSSTGNVYFRNMKVYKFGGASIKNADAIKNLTNLISEASEPLFIIISALGKTTNALEDILNAYLNKLEHRSVLLNELRRVHDSIANDLLPNDVKLKIELDTLFHQLLNSLESSSEKDFDQIYDEVVAFGELLSTKIVAAWLIHNNLPVKWLDIRDYLITDDWHRNARILWDESSHKVNQIVTLNEDKLFLTQGFIGRSKSGSTTTLGREGSDYTAAALAYMLDANEMTVWKDVEGIFSADPAEFPEAVMIPEISYSEAIELSFFGAKIIHPKTIKPLQNKKIPLRVRSFLNISKKGTLISEYQTKINYPPIRILKKNQVLISISPKDFSFISDDHLSAIFSIFARHRLRVNLSENSALSFTVCTDNDPQRVEKVLASLKQNYQVKFNENLELLTIRHYRNEMLEDLQKRRLILLEQRNRTTLRIVSSY